MSARLHGSTVFCQKAVAVQRLPCFHGSWKGAAGMPLSLDVVGSDNMLPSTLSAGGALVPEMLEQRHAEFLADAQQFLLQGGQVGWKGWVGSAGALRGWCSG